MAEIVLRGVSKDYGGLRAVDRMELHVRDGEFFVILGPSGAGKTTTLKMIAGVEPVTEGVIEIDGRVVNDLRPEERDIAMVFESYALYSHLTVYDNIAFPLLAPRAGGLSGEEIERRVVRVAGMLKIDRLLGRKPAQLSGGQRQRVALGRAMVREPAVFLMDEPLSHLDARIKFETRSELANLRDSISATIIYVTHDYNEALALGDRIAVLNQGKIVQVGTPEEIYHHPADRFVAESVGDPSMNFLPGRLTESGVEIGLGDGGGGRPIPFDGERRERLAARAGEEVLVGVRPGDMKVFREHGIDSYLSGKVYVRETLGDDSLLVASVDGELLDVLVDPAATFDLDQTVYLTWEPEKSHFFSSETGTNVLI